MCGLAGIFDPRLAPVDQAALRRMTTALAHRGPDGEGFHVEPGVGFGHRRLAIIDIGGGVQPMFNEDGSVVIVFNGEIYNFAVLRDRLIARGHVFRNRCDTEAIVHAWEEWGPDCLQHLSGMFAFALWDRGRGQLFLARDRVGKKPLYYTRLPDGSVSFASELAALRAGPPRAWRISRPAVADYFAFGYVPDPDSIYEDVRKLAPAHYLLIGRDQKPGAALPAPARYWRPRPGPVPASLDDAADELTAQLDTATAARLVADVPLGVFLSGGADSAAVTLAAARSRAGLDAFTIGFSGDGDEREAAAAIAAVAGACHHTEQARADYLGEVRRLAVHFGEPFADPSATPTHAVSALTRRHVTVALSGDGGDEALAGYRRHRWHMLAEAVRARLPAPVRRHALGALARAWPALHRAPRWLRARHTLTELSLDSALGYYRTLCRVHDERRRALFSPQLLATLDGHDPAARVTALMDEAGTDDPLARAQYVDVHTWLPGAMLTKVDRASMATGLEVRSPLLDHDLLAWGVYLPARMKLAGGTGKRVLRRALERRLPRALIYRSKQGFAEPLGPLLRREAVTVRARLLGGPMLDCGLFRPDALARLADTHAAGEADNAGVIWPLLCFEAFLLSHEQAVAPVSAVAGAPR